MTIAAAVRPATTSARSRPPDGAAPARTPGGAADVTDGGSLLGHELLADAGELGELLLADLRILQTERVQGLDDDRGDDDPREPLVVRGDDVPRRVVRGRLLDHRLVGLHVVLPEPALLRIGGRELPVLRRVVD